MGRLGFNTGNTFGKKLSTFSGLHYSGVLRPASPSQIAQWLYDYSEDAVFLDKVATPLQPPISVDVPCSAYDGISQYTEVVGEISPTSEFCITVDWSSGSVGERIGGSTSADNRFYFEFISTNTVRATVGEFAVDTFDISVESGFNKLCIRGNGDVLKEDVIIGNTGGQITVTGGGVFLGAYNSGGVAINHANCKISHAYLSGFFEFSMTENPPLDVGGNGNDAIASTATESTATGIQDYMLRNGYTPPPLSSDTLPAGAYGVEWDSTNPDPDVDRMTRIGDMTLHASLPVQSGMYACVLNDRGNELYKLDPDDWDKKANGEPSKLDGTDGQVMVRIPQYWFRFETDGLIERWIVSAKEQTGYERIPAQYVSAYEATVQRTTSKLASVKSTDEDYRGGNNNAAWDSEDRTLINKPATAISRTSFRTYARNRGTGWEMYNYWAHRSLMVMFVTEYATRNSQKPVNTGLTIDGYKQGGLGVGCTDISSTDWNAWNSYYPFIPCGHTDALGCGTGEVSFEMPAGYGVKTTRANRYRGIENPFGHIWKNADGVNLRIFADTEATPVSEVWLASDPADWHDSDYAGYTKVGELPRANGYIQALISGHVLPMDATGAGSTTYWSDYFYTSLPGSGESLRTVRFGGSASHGSAAGFGYSNSYNSPSNTYANIGSRLCFIPEFSGHGYDPALTSPTSGAITITDTLSDKLSAPDLTGAEVVTLPDMPEENEEYAAFNGVNDYSNLTDFIVVSRDNVRLQFDIGGDGAIQDFDCIFSPLTIVTQYIFMAVQGDTINEACRGCGSQYTISIDGVQQGVYTRGDAYALLSDRVKHRVLIEGLDLSLWEEFLLMSLRESVRWLPARLYGLEIDWDSNGTWDHVLIPTTSNNLYDTITGEYLPNLGTGDITARTGGTVSYATAGFLNFYNSGQVFGRILIDGVETFNTYANVDKTTTLQPNLAGGSDGTWQTGAGGVETLKGTRVIASAETDIVVDARDYLPIGVTGSKDDSKWYNGSSAKYRATDPYWFTVGNYPNFWVDETGTAIDRTQEEIDAFLSFDLNTVMVWKEDAGTLGRCVSKEILLYPKDYNFSPAGYQKTLKYAQQYSETCGGGFLVPYTIDSGDGIGPESNWYPIGDNLDKVYLVEDV